MNRISPIHLILIALFSPPPPGLAKDHEGEIVIISPSSITVGKTHSRSYKINAATSISLNGQRAPIAALRPGMGAVVTADTGIAASVSAVDDPLKIGSLDVKS